MYKTNHHDEEESAAAGGGGRGGVGAREIKAAAAAATAAATTAAAVAVLPCPSKRAIETEEVYSIPLASISATLAIIHTPLRSDCGTGKEIARNLRMEGGVLEQLLQDW